MNGQRIGYIRVSTVDQNTERQLDGIQLDKTFLDKASGRVTKRPQLELLMSFVRSGDTLIVHSMDRLARDQNDLHSIVQSLTGKGVRIEFVKEHLTFTGDDSPISKLMLSVMGAVHEFERALIKERQLGMGHMKVVIFGNLFLLIFHHGPLTLKVLLGFNFVFAFCISKFKTFIFN